MDRQKSHEAMQYGNMDGTCRFLSFPTKSCKIHNLPEIQDFSMRPVATQVASQMFQHHHAEYISSIDIHIYGQWISTNRKHQHDVGQLLQVFDVCFSVKPDTSTKLIICANTVRLGRYALSQICHTFEHHITKETFRNSWQRCMLVINLFPTVARTQEHNKTSWFLAESMSFATPA